MIGSQEEASTLTVVLKVSAEAGQKEIFNSYFKKALMLSEAQRLDVVVSLAMGNLNEFIPLVSTVFKILSNYIRCCRVFLIQ